MVKKSELYKDINALYDAHDLIVKDQDTLDKAFKAANAMFCQMADAVAKLQESNIDTLCIFKRVEALEQKSANTVIINTKLDDMRTRIDRLQRELVETRRNAVNINTIKSFEHDIEIHTKWLQDLERMIKALKPKAKAKPKAKPNGKHTNAIAARGSHKPKRRSAPVRKPG